MPLTSPRTDPNRVLLVNVLFLITTVRTGDSPGSYRVARIRRDCIESVEDGAENSALIITTSGQVHWSTSAPRRVEVELARAFTKWGLPSAPRPWSVTAPEDEAEPADREELSV